jgi:hypothetical protein
VGIWLKDIGRGPQTFDRSAAEPQPKKHLPRRHGDTEKTQKQWPIVKVKTSTQEKLGRRGELKKKNASLKGEILRGMARI